MTNVSYIIGFDINCLSDLDCQMDPNFPAYCIKGFCATRLEPKPRDFADSFAPLIDETEEVKPPMEDFGEDKPPMDGTDDSKPPMNE